MGLLEDIEDAAVDSTVDLSVVLRKCKILASRLGHEPFNRWVEQELNGYASKEDLPGYRVLDVQSRGHFVGLLGSGLKNALIPPMLMPDEHRDMATTAYLMNGISAYVALTKDNPSKLLRAQWSPDAVALFGARFYQNMNCLEAWQDISASAIVALLDTVRNRVLSFVLEIGSIAPDAGEPTPTAAPLAQHTVSQIFNMYILGGRNTVLPGASGLKQDTYTVTINTIQRGDFDSLKEQLVNLGVAPEDLDELQAALASDQPPESAERFGDRVSAWMGKMVSKAASGVWTVGVSAAGQVLAKAVASYYGIGP